MDFRLSEDQKQLQHAMRAFCERRVSFEALRALSRRPSLDRELWSALAELGVFGLRLTEERGGAGLGVSDAVVVFAELGRRLVPGPLAWTHLAADLVDGAASGKVIVGGLDLMVLDSGPILIEHLSSLDVLLVLTPDGVFRVDARNVNALPVEVPLDPLTPIHFAQALPHMERVAGSEEAARLRDLGAVLVSGQLLGIAEATLELSVQFAKEREQFGRPIGSFQAIKHMLADMFVRQEIARAAAYAAGASLDHADSFDTQRAVSMAKLNTSECARKNALACIQVHGGMGFTWELPAHFYLKRTTVLENVFGAIDTHADRMAERLSNVSA
jgi:alkylation response protein AidB-like acyl-CoA dehydrogenase